MEWEKNIFGMVPQSEWLNIGTVVTRPNDPIDRLFGDERTDNLVAYWQTIANEYQIPVMAQFHGFDTEAQKTFRVPVDTHNIEKGLIKVKINQSERLRALTRSGVQNQQMLDYVLNDGIRLADQVITRTKVAKNELMATGKVTIRENNLNLSVDYGVPAAQTAYTIDLSATADIPSQLQAIIDEAHDKGVILTGIMTSRKNINKMRRNELVQIEVSGTVGAGALVKKSALEAWLEEEYGINTVIEQDATYGASASIGADDRPIINTKRYFPENVLTFFATNPSGRMGVGLWGDSPEVDLAALMKVNASAASNYVYISQWVENDPAVLWTKASGLFMPVLYNPNSLYIATVADDFLDKPIVEGGTADLPWGYSASDLGTSVAVANGAITGTLKYVSSGALANDWGAGNFLYLKWSNIDSKANSIKVGLEPSAGAGMQECYSDPDRNGVFKITNKNIQKFKIVVSDGEHSNVSTYDLSGLTLLNS